MSVLPQDMSDAESLPESSPFILNFKKWILSLNIETESAALGNDKDFHEMLSALTSYKADLSLESTHCGLWHLPHTVASSVGWRSVSWQHTVLPSSGAHMKQSRPDCAHDAQVTAASVLEKVTAYDKSCTWPPGHVSVNLDPEGGHVSCRLLAWPTQQLSASGGALTFVSGHQRTCALYFALWYCVLAAQMCHLLHAQCTEALSFLRLEEHQRSRTVS